MSIHRQIAQMMKSPTPPAGGIPTSGLMAWYKLDEGSGLTANDSSGRGNTMTMDSDITWTVDGLLPTSLIFSDILLTDLVRTGAQSIIVFVKRTVAHGERTFVYRIARSNTSYPSAMRVNNHYDGSSYVLAVAYTGDTPVQITPAVLGDTIDDYYLCGFRFDTNVLTANRNLDKVTTAVPDAPQNIYVGSASAFRIGQNKNYTRDLIFYDRYITDEELEQIYNELI